jgi:hypothetical protein
MQQCGIAKGEQAALVEFDSCSSDSPCSALGAGFARLAYLTHRNLCGPRQNRLKRQNLSLLSAGRSYLRRKTAVGSLRPSRSAKESADLRSLPMGNENKDSDQVVENRVLELQSL